MGPPLWGTLAGPGDRDLEEELGCPWIKNWKLGLRRGGSPRRVRAARIRSGGCSRLEASRDQRACVAPDLVSDLRYGCAARIIRVHPRLSCRSHRHGANTADFSSCHTLLPGRSQCRVPRGADCGIDLRHNDQAVLLRRIGYIDVRARSKARRTGRFSKAVGGSPAGPTVPRRRSASGAGNFFP